MSRTGRYPTLDLNEFREWLRKNRNCTESTVYIYAHRVQWILGTLGVPLEDERLATLQSPAAIEAAVADLSASAKRHAPSAWKAFRDWLAFREGPKVAIAVPSVWEGVRPAGTGTVAGGLTVPERGTAPADLPEDVQAAVWHLLTHSEIQVNLLHALRWYHCHADTRDIATAFLVQVRPGPGVPELVIKRPLLGLQALYQWAEGAYDPTRPLVPAERGGSVPATMEKLHRIKHLGQRQRIPLLLPSWNLTAFPPPPPKGS